MLHRAGAARDTVAVNTSTSRHSGLRWIALFKLGKALLLLAVGVGVLTLVHQDLAQVLRQLVAALHVDPENRYLHKLIARLGLMTDRQLQELSLGSFVYAAVQLTEGVGLWRGKAWAEYLTVVATSSLIPLELYELSRHLTWPRVLVLAINVLVVGYLVWLLRTERRRVRAAVVSLPGSGPESE